VISGSIAEALEAYRNKSAVAWNHGFVSDKWQHVDLNKTSKNDLPIEQQHKETTNQQL